MISEIEQAQGRRLITTINCVGCIPGQVFLGSVLLLFLTSLAMNRVGIMVCLSIPAFVAAVCQIPFAHWADRVGKKKIGHAGMVLVNLTFIVLLAATFVSLAAGRMLALGAVAVYAVGCCLFISGWFALLLPMIPAPIRAAYFGRMRLIYQAVSVAAGLGCSALLEWRSSPESFAGLFVLFWAMTVVWQWLYTRMREVEKPDPAIPPLRVALGNVIRLPTYLPFCAYAFLLSLFAGGCPILFGMIEKTYLHLSDGTVVLLANVRMLGAMLGFLIGGRFVARMGTKAMFLGCHFAFGAILFLFLLRDACGGPLVPMLMLPEFLFGMVWAASSVAFTVEMYALIPPEGKSLSTSVFMTLQGTGVALGGMLMAGALRLGMFRNDWSFAGTVRSDYDAILLICGTLVMVVAMTLGLVPSVTGRAQGPSCN